MPLFIAFPLSSDSTVGWLPCVTKFHYRLAVLRHGLAMAASYIVAYSRIMMHGVELSTSNARSLKGNAIMKKALSCLYVLLVLAGTSLAAELPGAPSSVAGANPAIPVFAPVSAVTLARSPVETRIVNQKFIALAVVSTGSTFADSYTTLFARENWLAGKKGVCNAEVQSAYLYGTHPTVARAYAVASVKSATSIAASYYLRKHHRKFWSLPLIANSIFSLEGTTQNMVVCN